MKPKQPWLAVLLSIMGLGFVLFVGSYSNHFKTYRVPAAGMSPTLKINDYILLNKTYYDNALPQRRDVVVFRYPIDPSMDFVKRIIGLPSDELEIRNKIVYINGSSLVEPYTQNLDSRIFPADPTLPTEVRVRDNIAKLKVPEGQYFVLGDNRDYSLDSRFWGFRKHQR